MSRARYASITADLLARKGDARPWQPPIPQDASDEMMDPEPPPFVGPREHVMPEMPHEMVHELGEHESVRRCSLRLSECEYQRLGIVAVKKDTTRQQILRQAVEHYLTVVESEYGRACGCLSGQGCGASS